MSSAYTRIYVRVWRTSIAARCLRQIGRCRSKKRWHGRNRTVLSLDRSSLSVETRHCPSKGGSTFCLLPLRRQLVVLDLSAEACACLSGSSCWDSAAATLIACVKHQSPTHVCMYFLLEVPYKSEHSLNLATTYAWYIFVFALLMVLYGVLLTM